MITINQPRYHDRKVLIARYRIPCGKDVTVKILYGAYKGTYKITNQAICASPVESMTTRYGKSISMRAVDLDNLERMEDEQ